MSPEERAALKAYAQGIAQRAMQRHQEDIAAMTPELAINQLRAAAWAWIANHKGVDDATFDHLTDADMPHINNLEKIAEWLEHQSKAGAQ